MTKRCQKCRNSLDESAFEILGKLSPRKHGGKLGDFTMGFRRDEICRGCRSFKKIKKGRQIN